MKKGNRALLKGYKIRDSLSRKVEKYIMGHELFEIMSGRIEIKDLPKEVRKKYDF